MEESAKIKSNKNFEIQRALEDRDLVEVHSRVLKTLSDQEIAIIHIFRFEKDKITELWNFGQASIRKNK